MRRHITIQPHLPLIQLHTRYLKAKDVVASRQWHILWLLAKGRSVADVVDVTGYCADWIREIVRRYNREGEHIIGDGRKDNPGAQPFLSHQQKQELLETIQHKPLDGGLWTGVKVAAWIKEKTGRDMIYPQRGWEYLRKLGFSLKVPRRQHKKASKVMANDFKKNSPQS